MKLSDDEYLMIYLAVLQRMTDRQIYSIVTCIMMRCGGAIMNRYETNI